MFFLFKRKSREEKAAKHSWITNSINTAINKVHTRWANWMNDKTKDMPRRVLFMLSLVLITFSGIFCIYLIGFDRVDHAFTITRIRQPANVLQPIDSKQRNAIMNEADHEKMTGLLHLLDSLSKIPQGKPVYDSLMKNHPGLLDSLRLMENLYQSQLKK